MVENLHVAGAAEIALPARDLRTRLVPLLRDAAHSPDVWADSPSRMNVSRCKENPLDGLKGLACRRCFSVRQRFAEGTSRYEIEPAFFQPSRKSHVFGWYTTSGS